MLYLYKKATYAARTWYDLEADNNIEVIERAQRRVLIGVTQAYKIVNYCVPCNS